MRSDWNLETACSRVYQRLRDFIGWQQRKDTRWLQVGWSSSRSCILCCELSIKSVSHSQRKAVCFLHLQPLFAIYLFGFVDGRSLCNISACCMVFLLESSSELMEAH